MGTATIKRQQSRNGSFFLMLCVVCLALSLIIHFFFFQKAKRWEMPGFSPESYDTIVPRTFRMKRIEIDPSTLAEDKKPDQQDQKKVVPVLLEKEEPQNDNPDALKAEKNMMKKPQEVIPVEKPEAKQITTQVLDNMLRNELAAPVKTSKGDLPKNENNALDSIMDEPVKLTGEKENILPETMMQNGSPQFSSLDDLLAATGSVKKNTAPILMPTDLLFEYDSDVLKPAAAESLTKLGSLIKKNAKASFRIEGHTDSFGTEEYNMNLSLRRAEAVKKWLAATMGIDASGITTIGLGKSRLLVPASGSVEQQQLNRRVEIVVSVPK